MSILFSEGQWHLSYQNCYRTAPWWTLSRKFRAERCFGQCIYLKSSKPHIIKWWLHEKHVGRVSLFFFGFFFLFFRATTDVCVGVRYYQAVSKALADWLLCRVLLPGLLRISSYITHVYPFTARYFMGSDKLCVLMT